MSQFILNCSSELVEKCPKLEWTSKSYKACDGKMRQVKRVGFSRELRRNIRYKKKRPVCPATGCGKAAHMSR